MSLVKKKIAQDIYDGIYDKNIDLNIKNWKSKNLELLPLISLIEKLKKEKINSANNIEQLLKEDEVIAFSRIEYLKEKVRLHCIVNDLK